MGAQGWELDTLRSMSANGQLYDINPLILIGIAAEESGFEVNGAGYNSAGYGGYFGIGANKYPGGQVSVATLLTDSLASFEEQAVVAASAFAEYLAQNGGDVVKAESEYQTGNPNAEGSGQGGVGVVQQYLAGQSPYAGGDQHSQPVSDSGGGGGGSTGVGLTAAEYAALGPLAGNPTDVAYLQALNNQAAQNAAIPGGVSGTGSIAANPQGTLADVIANVLAPYGLNTPTITQWALAEITAYASQNMSTAQIGEQIGIDLQAPILSTNPQTAAAQQAFQALYPGMALRAKAGLPPITVAQYQAYQDQAATLAQAAGLPTGFMTTAVIGNLIGADVGTTELTDRIQKGYQAATQANPETLTLLQHYYPQLFPQGVNGGAPTNGALAAYYLDPKITQATLDNQITAAQIGTEGVNSEFGGIPVAQAQQLQQAGVTQQTARSTFQQLSKLVPLENQLPGEANAPGTTSISQGQLVQEGFFGANQQELENVQSNRLAPFRGGGGYASTAKGVVGAGSASSAGTQGT